MSSNGIQNSFDFFKSDEGRKETIRQIDIENGRRSSLGGIIGANRDLKSLTDGKGVITPASLITGNNKADSKTAKFLEGLDKRKDKTSQSYFAELKRLKTEGLARNHMEKDTGFVGNYLRRNLGLGNSEVTKMTTPVYGGGGAELRYFLGSGINNNIGAAQHLNRAAHFAAGKGLGTDMLNNAGLMTKHQKAILRSNAGLSTKFGAAVAPAVGIAFAATDLASYISGERDSTLTDNIATDMISNVAQASAAIQGYRVTKELTHAATSLVSHGGGTGKLGLAGRAFKGATGIGAGIIGGGVATLATGAIFSAAQGMASIDNSINRTKRKLSTGDTTSGTSTMTNQLMTSRQRALDKLSKSSMNDRAMTFGNEARILKGIM